MEHITAQQMIDQRGYEVAEWTWLAEFDPDFMTHYNALTTRAFHHYADDPDAPEQHLSVQIKELIAIALLAAQRDWERFPTHLHRLLDLGTSDREILEALQVALVISGGPALRGGVEALRKARAERA